MRRRKLLGVMAGLAVLVAICVLAFQTQSGPHAPVTSISRVTFSRIKTGMTLAEVTAILGPPGNVSTMETEFDESAWVGAGDIFGVPDAQIARIMIWSTDTAMVTVSFDRAGKLVIAGFCPLRPSTETTWSKTWKRIERRWRKWFP
jgi:outer membrane protein assembly factor BamE (lipoprotein component of BamABCDE complex)